MEFLVPLLVFRKTQEQYFRHAPMESGQRAKIKWKGLSQSWGRTLTVTIIETMLFNMPSISTGSPSLKQISQTPIILCKSSSIPLLDFSSDISAPLLLQYLRNSCA